MYLKLRFIYFISLIEGAAVMVSEIAGAKLLAPFYGNSLTVWSSVMAITLSGLASGYFIGAQLSKSENKQKTLFKLLFLASLSIIAMPYLKAVIYGLATMLSLIPAVVCSVIVILFLPILLLGATSPMIIALLTKDNVHAGESSGRVYAISTIGGIIATFLTSFYFIPTLGITNTLLVVGALLMSSSVFLVVIKKNKVVQLSLCLIPLLLCVLSFKRTKINNNVMAYNEGILGTLEVKETPYYLDSAIILRKLLINNIVQTEMNVNSKKSASNYINLLDSNIASFPKGNAIVFGLGGGLVANLLSNNKYNVTGVEFDNRIIEAAKKYFYLNSTIEAVCDDARHYLNHSTTKYDLVVFDVFKAEEQPAHIITKESLINLQSLLNEQALVIINWHGYLTGDIGKGTRCLLSTLKEVGFNVKIIATHENEDYRNLIVLASMSNINKKFKNELSIEQLSLEGIINTDDKPILEFLNAQANQKWRTNYLQNEILVNRAPSVIKVQ